MPITGSVGVNGLNRREDVMHVQRCIFTHRHWLDAVPWVSVNGNCGVHTIAAIRKFQATAAALYRDDCDGVVSPLGFKIRRLEMAIIPKPVHRVSTVQRWRREAGPLRREDFEGAATTLGCEIAAIRAVARQEAPRGAFDHAGRPTILYERHYFGRLSEHIWDPTHRDISNRNPSIIGSRTRDGYGAFGAQYEKLYRAATLNENAALQSASWGMFQMMGDKYDDCGFATPGAFVYAMIPSEASQLGVFVSYINRNAGPKRALREKNWARFALLYNGRNYAQNNYDTNIARFYEQFAAEERALQRPCVPRRPRAATRP